MWCIDSACLVSETKVGTWPHLAGPTHHRDALYLVHAILNMLDLPAAANGLGNLLVFPLPHTRYIPHGEDFIFCRFG